VGFQAPLADKLRCYVDTDDVAICSFNHNDGVKFVVAEFEDDVATSPATRSRRAHIQAARFRGQHDLAVGAACGCARHTPEPIEQEPPQEDPLPGHARPVREKGWRHDPVAARQLHRARSLQLLKQQAARMCSQGLSRAALPRCRSCRCLMSPSWRLVAGEGNAKLDRSTRPYDYPQLKPALLFNFIWQTSSPLILFSWSKSMIRWVERTIPPLLTTAPPYQNIYHR
jgi:hypothetical protein